MEQELSPYLTPNEDLAPEEEIPNPGYSLIDDTEKYFTVRHPNGQEATIAKKGLTDQEISKIQSMPGLQSKIEEKIPTAAMDPGMVSSGIAQDIAANVARSEISNVDREAETQDFLNALNNPTQGATFQEPQPQDVELVDYEMPYDEAVYSTQTPAIGTDLGAFNQKQNEFAKQTKSAQDTYLQDMQNVTKVYEKEKADLSQETERLKQDIAQNKIDPNRFWNRQTGIKGGMNKVLSIIGIVLGGAAFNKTGVNPAMAAINKAIDDDIMSQKEAIGNKKTLLDANMKKYGDLVDAEKATKLDLLNMFSAQLESISKQSTNEQVKLNAAIELDKLNVQKSELIEELSAKKADRYLMQIAVKPNPSPEQVAAIATIKPELAEQIVPNVGYVLNKGEAPKVAETKSTYDSMYQQLMKLKAIRQKYGAQVLPGPVKAVVKQIKDDLLLQTAVMNKLGALSGSDIKLAGATAPDASSIGWKEAEIDNAINIIQNKTDKFFKSRVANYQRLPNTHPKVTPAGY